MEVTEYRTMWLQSFEVQLYIVSVWTVYVLKNCCVGVSKTVTRMQWDEQVWISPQGYLLLLLDATVMQLVTTVFMARVFEATIAQVQPEQQRPPWRPLWQFVIAVSLVCTSQCALLSFCSMFSALSLLDGSWASLRSLYGR